MNNLTQFNVHHVDLEVLRKIFWQTLHFDIGSLLLNHPAAQFDASALLFVYKVQGYIHFYGLIHAHSKEVSMHRKPFGGVALNVLDDGVVRVPSNLYL